MNGRLLVDVASLQGSLLGVLLANDHVQEVGVPPRVRGQLGVEAGAQQLALPHGHN